MFSYCNQDSLVFFSLILIKQTFKLFVWKKVSMSHGCFLTWYFMIQVGNPFWILQNGLKRFALRGAATSSLSLLGTKLTLWRKGECLMTSSTMVIVRCFWCSLCALGHSLTHSSRNAVFWNYFLLVHFCLILATHFGL